MHFIAGIRQPSGLPNLRLYGAETGIQRAAQALKPSSGRNDTAASSNTDKLRAPTGTQSRTL